MARQRMVRTERFDDRPAYNRLSSDTRLLYIRCMQLADDEGVLNWDPHTLKGATFKYQENITHRDVAVMMDQLVRAREVFVYEFHDETFGFLIQFHNEQIINRPSQMRYPAPDWGSAAAASALAESKFWQCGACSRPIAQDTLEYDSEGPQVVAVSRDVIGRSEPRHLTVTHRACAQMYTMRLTGGAVPLQAAPQHGAETTMSLFPETHAAGARPMAGLPASVARVSEAAQNQEEQMGAFTAAKAKAFTVDATTEQAVATKKQARTRTFTLNPEHAETVTSLCHYLHSKVVALLTPGQAGVLRVNARWQQDMQYMLTQDKYTDDQIRAIIDWAVDDPFWRGNIQSPRKLRKQFPRISMSPQFVAWARRHGRPTIVAEHVNVQPTGPRGIRPSVPGVDVAPEQPAFQVAANS